MRLTEAGRALVPYAEAVSDALRGATRELTELRAAGGRLRFGAFATADAALVPQALAAFRDRHPRVRVTREEGLSPTLLDRLTAGRLDLAVVSTTGRAPLESYALHHLLDETVYVAVPAGHPLASTEGPVRLARLAGADWIAGSARPEGTLLDTAVRQGFRPRVAHVVAEWTAKQGYVPAGLGVTLVPALAAASVRPDVALLPLHAEDAPPRAVYAATVCGPSRRRHGPSWRRWGRRRNGSPAEAGRSAQCDGASARLMPRPARTEPMTLLRIFWARSIRVRIRACEKNAATTPNHSRWASDMNRP